MSADRNVTTVEGIYESFGKGDVPAILEQLNDDVDWAAEASSDAAPWYGLRKGKDEVVGFFEGIGGAVDVLEFSPDSFASNDDEVMVRLRFAMRSKQTGREARMGPPDALLALPRRQGRPIPWHRGHRGDAGDARHLTP